MVTLAMDMVIAVAGSFWAGDLVGDLMGDAGTEGITSRAMQQGGLGLILTMLIISAPPMAASFFQGTLGNFMHFSAFGAGGGPVGQRPGESGYRGPNGYSPALSKDDGQATISTKEASLGGSGNPATSPQYGKSTIQPDEVKSSPRV
jgi:type IV secretion system protein VirB6